MKLQTQIPLREAEHQIDHYCRTVLLGSCFAEHIGSELSYYKFQNVQNPFGILFHPLAIENLVQRAMEQRAYTEEEVFFLNERWHCFDAHSVLSDVSKEQVLAKLNEGLAITHESLKNATHVCITLGTAWVYRHLPSNAIVANCHKVGQSTFGKELLDIGRIVASLHNIWSMIHSVNPKTQIICTVSPVRHLKDGVVENQLSKSHLISAVHEVMKSRSFMEGSEAVYFPSYEIMMDELRDYRFYAKDMIHPNEVAIAYIWEKFCSVWISGEARHLMTEIEGIQKGLQHRPFNPASGQHQQFLKSLSAKIAYIVKQYPSIQFNVPEL